MMDVINELLEKIDIIELARKYTELTPSSDGAYRGKCPIHHGKNDTSFVVYPNGHYYCFSCHSFGNAIQLYGEITGEPFYQAVEHLCEEYEVSNDDETYQKSKSAVGNNTRMAHRFHKQVEHIRDYLTKSRGLTDETINEFNLGFDYGGFMGSYPGMIIPIQDCYGRIVGFSKRRLDDGKPKYRNSADTQVFKKGNILFNWHRAIRRVKKFNCIHMVEGYMDCIAAHQQGLPCVAYMSAKPTKKQLILLSKLTQRFPDITVILATDNVDIDEAAKNMLPRIREDVLRFAPNLTIRCVKYPKGDKNGRFVSA